MKTAVLRLLVALCSSLCLHAATAAELEIASCDDFLRSGMPFRCLVRATVSSDEFARGPFIVQIAITQGGSVLVEQEIPLVALGQLREGLHLALIPAVAPDGKAEQSASLHVTLTNPTRTQVERIDRPLITPLSLQRALEARAQSVATHQRRNDPLPALWLEQAGERILDGPSIATCLVLADLDRRLGAWLAGAPLPPGDDDLRAYRDPIDNSVQPLRLRVPLGTAMTPVVLICGDEDPPPRKSAWKSLPETWRLAALEAGVSVVEAYPAGDLDWAGVAPRRALLALAAAELGQPRIRAQRVVLLGVGRGAAGAIQLAENQPERFAALMLVDPQLPNVKDPPDDPLRRWLVMQRTGGRPGNLAGMAIAICGVETESVRAWQNRVERSGGTVINGFRRPDAPAFWQAAVRDLVSGPAREIVVLKPGSWGRFTIDELAHWGGLGVVQWDAANHQLRTTGIARLRVANPTGIQVDGRPYVEPDTDTRRPRKVLGQATGPLAGYADGPFVMVVGTGESTAAVEGNRTLAMQFRGAWARHAHGVAPLVDDTAFRPLDYPHHHLVLVGNSSSNRVLRTLVDAGLALPVRWDAREITVGDAHFPRHQHRALALAWPHPALDGRLLVVLDGRPAWNPAGGLPLQGLPDLVIGGAEAGDPPALIRLFDNEWK